ncbi:hypothetical protein RB4783 [Rhodopirellula baltica SH 1]|uniref:Uncharacterized protein n=1 Tax=Rhodopirellula baltica (strain DSM 10527 / NCIMB 13988 / SH1) TaxID=243090 RepID=Q7UH87_RHOBA|nr:hypothetical protein RB4783 [Rhodopirellula baltica SH 1]
MLIGNSQRSIQPSRLKIRTIATSKATGMPRVTSMMSAITASSMGPGKLIVSLSMLVRWWI